jgi:excisionase family DNA binding protein
VKDPDTLTTGEVARLWRCSCRTVAKQADAGLLRSWRVTGGSGGRRFLRADVLAFMRARGIPAPDERPALLVASAGPQLAAALRHLLPGGWAVEPATTLFEAGHKFAARRHGAVLFDMCLGASDCLAAARALAGLPDAPALYALCCEDADPASLPGHFAAAWAAPCDPAAVARRVAAREGAAR